MSNLLNEKQIEDLDKQSFWEKHDAQAIQTTTFITDNIDIMLMLMTVFKQVPLGLAKRSREPDAIPYIAFEKNDSVRLAVSIWDSHNGDNEEDRLKTVRNCLHRMIEDEGNRKVIQIYIELHAHAKKLANKQQNLPQKKRKNKNRQNRRK